MVYSSLIDRLRNHEYIDPITETNLSKLRAQEALHRELLARKAPCTLYEIQEVLTRRGQYCEIPLRRRQEILTWLNSQP